MAQQQQQQQQMTDEMFQQQQQQQQQVGHGYDPSFYQFAGGRQQYGPSYHPGGGGHGNQFMGNPHGGGGGGGMNFQRNMDSHNNGGSGNGNGAYGNYYEDPYYTPAVIAAEKDFRTFLDEQRRQGMNEEDIQSQYINKPNKIISHEHDQVVKKTFHLHWEGTLQEFAKGGGSIQWQAHPNSQLDPTNRLISVETKLVSVRNTGPVNVAIKLHGTPTSVEAIGNNGVDFDFAAYAHTIQPQTFSNKMLYQRTRNNGVDIHTLSGWSSETEDSIRKSVLDRSGPFWKLSLDSPIIHVAFQNKDEHWPYLDRAIARNPKGIMLDAHIASLSEQFAVNVVKNLPFEEIKNVSATICRLDGKKFNDMTGITDGSAISAYKEENAKSELIKIDAELEKSYIVWRSDVDIYDDGQANNNNGEHEQ